MVTIDEPYFVLNRNKGVDIIHDPENLTERCNTDQIDGRKSVDAMTAEALIVRGDARACQHCSPRPQG